MSKIRSVAIAGAAGTLGPHVLKALLNANFQVTILTRSKKPEKQEGIANIAEVDYASVESLKAALKGVDAVVSTVGGEGTEDQKLLIDAAVAAGVKRFIPSEYGSCTTNPKVAEFPLYAGMFKIKRHLQEKAELGSLSWTVLSTTSLSNVAKAIVGILKNPEATKNKIVSVSEAIITQNMLLGIAQELRPEIKWETTQIQSSAVLKEALNKAGAGDFSMPVLMKILAGTALGGDTYGGAFEGTDNEMLGVKELTEEDLKLLVTGQLNKTDK